MNPNPIPHPSFFIDAHLTDTIRHFATEAEKTGKLHAQQLSIIYEQKWFNLFVPQEYGGLHLSLTEGLKIEESLAWTDGSVGWTVTLCSGANWFVGFLQPEIAGIIFNTNKVCLAGSGRSSGIAKMIDDGYDISGYWHYATGAANATAFTANCIIEKEGVIIRNEDNSPLVSSFIFLREEVKVHEDWNSIGMVATSSHSFEVKGLQVNKNRRFLIDEKLAVLDGPVYQYPFLQFAETTLAVNSSGIACRYIDLFEVIIKERETNKSNSKEIIDSLILRLTEARKQLQEIRQLFYETVQQSWNEYNESRIFECDTLKEVSKVSRKLASTARKLVDELYPYSGLVAANRDSEINRVWRNLHTASQHPLLLFF